MAATTQHRKRSGVKSASKLPGVPANEHVWAASERRVVRSGWRMLPGCRRFLARHQLDIPLALIGGCLLAWAAGFAWPEPLLFIQHPSPFGTYERGVCDVMFVAFYAIVLTAMRAVWMQAIYHPLARLAGIRSAKKQQRFAEQGAAATYFIISWSLGVYLYTQTEYYFDNAHLFIGYPHAHLDGAFKAYYLVQLAFWIHQVMVLATEEPRKDFLEMIAHHAVTIVLIISSYTGNLTRCGHVVLCIMDISDIFLSLAKMSKYVHQEAAANVFFGIFVLTWIQFRFYFFATFIHSVYAHSHEHASSKWDPANGFYYTENVRLGFLILLSSLMVLMVIWFLMILRVVRKALIQQNVEDVRSDDEDGSDGAGEADARNGSAHAD